METGNGDNVGEEKPPVGEDSGIEDYDGPGIDSDILHYYVTGDSTRLHLGGNVCTLEDEYENVLVTFEGNRVKENMPQFSNRNQLVIDEGEDFYRVYNASSGVMLCDVKKEADCIVTDRFIVYEQAAEYIVKNYKNTEIFRTEKGTDDHFLNSKEEQARFIFQNAYFVYQSDGGRTLITNSGVVVAEGLDSILFNDENNDKEKAEEQIFICEKNEKYGAFNAAGDKILDFIYENAEFFNGHVNALRIKQESGKEGIVDYTGKVIIPLEYDSVGYGNYIEEAGNASIVEYQLINSRLDSYYGKQGSRIYYLDEEGNKTEEVQYVKTTENGRDLNDYLTLNKTPETPKEYSTTGNILVMDNAYSGSAGFGRSRIYENVEQNKIRFLLIDENSSKIGVFEYYFGDFTFMGYQHWIWYIWMLGSRIFLLLLLAWIVLKLPYEEIADRFYFFRKDFTRKKMTKKKNGK